MIILITGGASGLGKSITEALCSNKRNSVYFTYSKSIGSANDIESRFSNAKAIKCDFNNEVDLEQLLQQINTLNIDVLINNAFSGNINKQYFHKNNVSNYQNDFLHNIVPVIKITQGAILSFRKKKFGKIITILSSAIVNKPPIGWSEYVAGKNYLHSLAKSWAVENGTFNITSNCISPAFMQTALTADIDERVVEEIALANPLKKILNTNEVADTVNYFVNCSQQINGVNFVINAASDIIN